MRFIRGLARVIFSLTFILSGFLKLIDPVGTGLIVDEYFSFMHLGFLSPAAIWFGMALATIEFTIGISVLIGLQMRFFTGLGLVFISFFTMLTLYLAIANPISDCGCFGKAIHLTNWQTFFKNVVLLLLALLIFFGRFKATVLASSALQWVFVGMFAALALYLAIEARFHNPRIDFTAYSVGTDLGESCGEDLQPQFETTFIYEKDGRRKTFDIENLPDSTWTFIDARTRLIGNKNRFDQAEFTPDTLQGSFFAITAYNPEKLDESDWAKLRLFATEAAIHGASAAIYTPAGGSDLKAADRKTLLTLNRSNGGITYIQDGVIVRKWSRYDIRRIDFDEVLALDTEDEIISHRSLARMYILSVFVSILLLLAILRAICRIFISK